MFGPGSEGSCPRWMDRRQEGGVTLPVRVPLGGLGDRDVLLSSRDVPSKFPPLSLSLDFSSCFVRFSHILLSSFIVSEALVPGRTIKATRPTLETGH